MKKMSDNFRGDFLNHTVGQLDYISA